MRLDPIILISQILIKECTHRRIQFRYTTEYVQRNQIRNRLCEFAALTSTSAQQPVMPDDHSKLVPPLPIPNRTVKRLRADDSADPCVKVGHRQALTTPPNAPPQQ